ncbi:MAG: CCA tRNA nucleotidyltransferase, partial [Oxalobacteraceae bacterium]
DVEAGRVRFVGDADERLAEDYLRALRWFRFYGRFGDPLNDYDAMRAITRAAPNLRQISVERVWAEISKIIAGPNADRVLKLIHISGVGRVIGLPEGDISALDKARLTSRNSAALMAIYGGEEVLALGQRWKWSKVEQKTAAFIVGKLLTPYGIGDAKRDIVEGIPVEIITALLATRGDDLTRRFIETWEAPAFPVSGNELIERGITGVEIGRWMKDARRRWIESDYTLGKTDMLGV